MNYLINNLLSKNSPNDEPISASRLMHPQELTLKNLLKMDFIIFFICVLCSCICASGNRKTNAPIRVLIPIHPLRIDIT